MSRRRAAEKRQILPDPKFGDVVVSKFVNCIMVHGKKSVAENIVYTALEQLARRKKGDAVALFHEALDKVKPSIEVKSRRVGGATYQVPVEVRADRALALAIRWIKDAAGNRGEKTMGDRLARELEDAIEQRGSAYKKREDTHKMAEANRAFAHYRW